ncbi:hypothetical protein F383_36590 [Gossypium arboreum]|uniref:Uncharacterized protein n=1 Tax=Gossypium arboreum TaxID=29729 RepID=A0A0B0N9G9_GOSAR|nr:hypothetical protein F383_36590 [Gossypium arboreum]
MDNNYNIIQVSIRHSIHTHCHIIYTCTYSSCNIKH